MISCNKCNVEKPSAEFSYRDKARGILHRHCKECVKQTTKRHYNNNKEDYKKQAMQWSKDNPEIRRAVRKERLGEYRGYKPCNCCTRKEIREYYMKCPKGYHVDHIQTLSKQGMHCIKNMQYLHPSEHSRKSCNERWYG